MQHFLIELLGLFYAICFLCGYVPQIIKIIKTKKCNDIAPSMYFLCIMGYFSCGLYIYILNGLPLGVILNCTGGIILNIIILCLYYKYRE